MENLIGKLEVVSPKGETAIMLTKSGTSGRTQWKQWLAAISATLSMVAVGTVYGWTTTMATRLDKDVISDYKVPFKISSDEFSWIVSIVTIASMMGSFLGAFLADTFGRKFCLLCSSVFFIIGWLAVIFATNVSALYASRIILGIGVGMSYTTNPMYVSEVADTNIRGALGTLIAINVFTGSLLTCCVAPWTSYLTVGIVVLAVPVVFFLTFIFFPESPYYLIKRNRDEAAKQAICFFKSCDDAEAQEELEEIRKIINEHKLHSQDWRISLRTLLSSNNRKAFAIVLGLIIAQQLSGNFTTMQYLQSVFKASAIGMNADVAVIIVFAVGLVSGVVATLTVEKAGRHPLLLSSSSGCAITLGILAFYFLQMKNPAGTVVFDLLPLIAVILFQVFYQSGLGTLPNALIGELFPTSAKGIAGAGVTISDGIFGFIVSKFYQVVQDTYGPEYNYFLFSGSCLVAFVLIYFCIPETKNKSFNEIQEELSKSVICC